MKLFLTTALLPLVASAAAAQGPDVIYYDFESGSAANTAVPGVGDGVASAVNFVSPGIAGSGAAEAMTGARIDSGWQVDLGQSSWTIGMWIDLSVGGNGFQYFYGSSSTGGMRCFCAGAAGVDGIMLRTLNGSATNDVILPGGAPSTGPTHCVWSYDANTLTVDGYVNGVLAVSVAQPAPIDYTGTAADFNVMDYTGSEMLAGNTMDDFRVYRRPLSAGEVMDWFNGAGGTLGSNYCVAEDNSTGGPASISAAGSAVATANDLTLTAEGMPPQQFGIFITSQTQAMTPVASGTLCLGGNIIRFQGPSQILQADASGAFSLQIDTQALPAGVPTPIVAGETWNFTAWFRDIDPAIGNTANFSDGVSITFQ